MYDRICPFKNRDSPTIPKGNVGFLQHDEKDHDYDSKVDQCTSTCQAITTGEVAQSLHLVAAIAEPNIKDTDQQFQTLADRRVREKDSRLSRGQRCDCCRELSTETAHDSPCSRSNLTTMASLGGDQEELDRKFAEQLQAEFNSEPLPETSLPIVQIAEETSPTEMAIDFAQRVIGSFDQMVDELLLKFPMKSGESSFLVHPAIDLSLVNTDALVFQAERGTQELCSTPNVLTVIFSPAFSVCNAANVCGSWKRCGC